MGINSTLRDGSHIIMWEFDHPHASEVYNALLRVAKQYQLPAIHVARSHPGGGFHAYCFRRSAWVDSLHIVSGTMWVDPGYISMCAMRGHWTLRLTDKGQGTPEHVFTIAGYGEEQCSAEDLISLVKYEAWAPGYLWTIGKRGL